MAKPENPQRREFYRMALETDIYYKPMDAPKEEEYRKLKTTDLSAGGFRCRSEIKLEEGEFLNCMLIAGYEALPVTARILKSLPDAGNPDLYDTRAIFYELDDQIRDRVVKYIFSKQRQAQSKLHKKKF